MTILEESVIKLDPRIMANRRLPTIPPRPRSTAHLHVMQIVRKLAIAAGKLDEAPEWEPFTETSYPLLPAMGVMWEEFLAGYLHGIFATRFVWQPGEYSADGIAGNPDGLIGLHSQQLWECKLTYKKIQPVSDVWIYIKQALAYLALTGLTWVRFDVLWVLSDYVKPYKPIATSTLLEFSQHEIDSWWQIMVATAREMEMQTNAKPL